MQIKRLFLIILLAIVASASYLWMHRHSGIELQCRGVLLHASGQDKSAFHSQMSLTIMMRKDKTGYSNLTGHVFAGDKQYVISRTSYFTYLKHQDKNGTFDLVFHKTEKAGGDNVPDELTSRYMHFFTLNKTNTLQLATLPSDNILVHSSIGPMMICVPQP